MAQSGPAGVEVSREFQPKFILCSLSVPGFDAVIAVVSEYGNDDERRKPKEADFDWHLIRPIGRAALEELINCLATRQ